jgi:large subunit ribosomal protein L18
VQGSLKSMLEKQRKMIKRKKRVRSSLHGTKKRPRLSIFRSNQKIYAQLIDDDAGKTLASYSSPKLAEGERKGKTKSEVSRLVGGELAKAAKKKKIKKVVFDRGGYKYHGRVKALAEGAREGGLEF